MNKQKSVNLKTILRHTLAMVVVFGAASGIGYLFTYVDFPDTNIVVIYLLAVHITTWLTSSFIFGIISSILATFAFNYYFTYPLFTFSVNDPNYIVTFITMTVTALVTSTLTSHAKRSASEAQRKEAETTAIYNLTNHLTEAEDMKSIEDTAISAISICFGCDAACLCFDENGFPDKTFFQQMSGKHIQRETGDVLEIKYRIEGLRTGFDAGEEFWDWPIYGGESILGIIRIPKDNAAMMNKEQIQLLHSMIESTALAMDRIRSAQQRMKSKEDTVKERYRANLLRAISHDIRTPLSSIIGTSEMLIDMTEQDDSRHDLVRGIWKEADWLRSLVENILSLTRLQDGKLAIRKRPEAVEEVVGEAVNHAVSRMPEYEITVNVPDELLIVPMDPKLIEQVILNLLENAKKHTQPGNEIDITVEVDNALDRARFSVRDRGVGIRDNDLPHIFETFYYSTDKKYADAVHGIGLGLAICETIVKAHGGEITARNRTDGQGAEFIFTLPMEVDKDEQI